MKRCRVCGLPHKKKKKCARKRRPSVLDDAPQPPSMYWDFDSSKYTEDGHPGLFNE